MAYEPYQVEGNLAVGGDGRGVHWLTSPSREGEFSTSVNWINEFVERSDARV